MSEYRLIHGKILSDPLAGNYFEFQLDDGTRYEVYPDGLLFRNRLETFCKHEVVYLVGIADDKAPVFYGMDIWLGESELEESE